MHVEEQEEVCLAASGLAALGESLPPPAAVAGTDSDDRQERDSHAGAASAAGRSYSLETSQGGGAGSWAVGTHSGLSGQTARSRAARRAEADAVLHPVLRLGWRPLCEVVCNGLHGLLLGGHDKDVYVRVTSSQWAGRPPVDVSQGGCIMTASQFEKSAGRSLSKKWKESIHVVGQGEGSRATLLNWLRRRAECDYGRAVVGRAAWVCWCSDGEYHQGTIASYNPDTAKHMVTYVSRSPDHLHLPLELLDFGAEQPVPGAAPAAAAAAAAVLATTVAEEASTQQQAAAAAAQHPQLQPLPPGLQLRKEGAAGGNECHPANRVWTQGSGVSVSSTTGSFLDDVAAAVAAAAAATAASGALPAAVELGSPAGMLAAMGRKLAHRMELEEQQRQVGSAELQQPPAKRARTAAAAAAATGAEPGSPAAAEQPARPATGQGQHWQQQQQQQATPPRRLAPFGSAITLADDALPRGGGASNGGTGPAAALAGLPPPPPAGLSASAAEMSAWLHRMALALEHVLDGGGTAALGGCARGAAAAAPPPPAQPKTPDLASARAAAAEPAPPAEHGLKAPAAPAARASPGPTARFQALLALARGEERRLRGWYDAMLLRCRHYTESDPGQLPQRLAELVVAGLDAAAAPALPLVVLAPGGDVTAAVAASSAAAAASAAPAGSAALHISALRSGVL